MYQISLKSVFFKIKWPIFRHSDSKIRAKNFFSNRFQTLFFIGHFPYAKLLPFMVMFGGLFENTAKGQVRWSRFEKTYVPMWRQFQRRFWFSQSHILLVFLKLQDETNDHNTSFFSQKLNRSFDDDDHPVIW